MIIGRLTRAPKGSQTLLKRCITPLIYSTLGFPKQNLMTLVGSKIFKTSLEHSYPFMSRDLKIYSTMAIVVFILLDSNIPVLVLALSLINYSLQENIHKLNILLFACSPPPVVVAPVSIYVEEEDAVTIFLGTDSWSEAGEHGFLELG
jgi:hypothetical protein